MKSAGGWGALRATARAVREQMDVVEAPLLLYRTNKPAVSTAQVVRGRIRSTPRPSSSAKMERKRLLGSNQEASNAGILATHTVSALLEWTITSWRIKVV